MRKCPSCGQLTLDIVPCRKYLECTRYSCGHREPVVDPEDARITELEAQVRRVRDALDGFDKLRFLSDATSHAICRAVDAIRAALDPEVGADE